MARVLITCPINCFSLSFMGILFKMLIIEHPFPYFCRNLNLPCPSPSPHSSNGPFVYIFQFKTSWIMAPRVGVWVTSCAPPSVHTTKRFWSRMNSPIDQRAHKCKVQLGLEWGFARLQPSKEPYPTKRLSNQGHHCTNCWLVVKTHGSV